MAVTVADLQTKFSADLSGLNRGIATANRKIQGFASGFAGSAGSFAIGGLIERGISSGLSALNRLGQAGVGALVSATMDAADFNAQISAIAANANATMAEVAPLKQLILDLGIDPKLKVSATEAADAVDMLVRNGMKLPDIMDGAARSTVLLANSTGAEFGTAADIATDAMSLFDIEAKNMGTAVDGITSVVTNSKFDINDYRLALAQAGGVAASVGVSFDDFNATIAAMAPLFASGSDAGTSFKTFLQRTVPQSKEAAAAIKTLGLEFYDSSGNLKSMAEISGELNDAFEQQITFSATVGGRTADQNKELKRLNRMYATTQHTLADYESGIKGAGLSEEKRAAKLDELRQKMEAIQNAAEPLLAINGESVTTTRQLTELEKNRYLTMIFGTDAMRAAAAMAGFTEEEFRNLQRTMGETDAETAAAKRMNNLAGDMEIFKSVVETTTLQIGDKFQPVMRELFQSLAPIVQDLSPKLVEMAGLLATGLESVIPNLQAFNDAFIMPALDSFIERVRTAMEVASGAGTLSGGIFAGVGSFTGGEVTVSADGMVTTVNWGDWIGVLDWNNYVVSLQWGDWIVQYDWQTGVSTLMWGDWVVPLQWNGYIVTFDWDTFVEQLNWPDWLTELLWGDWITVNSWDDWIPGLGWPDYVPGLSWSDFVNSINLADWVPSFPGWGAFFGGGGGAGAPPASDTSGGGGGGFNAKGTDYWRGGLTWVGEEGPELVNLPRGSRIYSNPESMAMAGAGAGVMGGDTFNISVSANVSNGIDIQQLAYQISDIIRKRQR